MDSTCRKQLRLRALFCRQLAKTGGLERVDGLYDGSFQSGALWFRTDGSEYSNHNRSLRSYELWTCHRRLQ